MMKTAFGKKVIIYFRNTTLFIKLKLHFTMKNLLTLLLMLLLTGTLVAQTETTSDAVTIKDYQRYIDKTFDMNYRNHVIKAVDLTADETKAFDKIFFDYIAKREKLQTKRADLIADFREEMKGDDSKKNQEEDRADFIEDYWETLIAGMDLKTEYFDDLEDKIPVAKVATYFMLDDAVDMRITNNSLATLIPTISNLDRPYSMRKAIRKTANKMASTKSMTKADDVSKEDYQSYIDSKLDMQLRNATFDALHLTKKEIIDVDPGFNAYMSKQDRLLEKRSEHLEDISEELKEDDDLDNHLEDYADFVEDYRENEIKAMELKKDYFDELEDKIGTRKATQFFLFQNAVENRITMNLYAELLPDFIIFDNHPGKQAMSEEPKEKMKKDKKMHSDKMATDKKMTFSSNTLYMVQNFDKWVTENHGQVSLSHEYTSDGLKTLVSTLELIKNDKNTYIPNFATKKAMILENAEQMTENWKSTQHADQTKEAFVALAQMMKALDSSNNLKSIASNLNKKTLLTDQASTIYRFFESANQSLQQLVDTSDASINTPMNERSK